ncbi:MAG: hypothetical protein Q7K57_08815 [Burkholderiaceae bacterium]|nr:hypothetical protein [Burkholderiaceae bacterium]
MNASHVAAIAFALFFSVPAMADTPPEPVDSPASTSKSVDDCEVEIGSVGGMSRQRALINCLLTGAGVQLPANAMTAEPKHFVEEFGIWEVNSAGGVVPMAVFINPNKKSAIKYIHMQVTMYNAVGDVIRSSIGGLSTAHLKFTGPLGADERTSNVTWKPIWYNSTADCLKIQSIDIEFMNGTRRSFVGRNLRPALSPELLNDCRPSVK